MLASGAVSEIALVFVGDEDFDTQVDRALAIVGRGLGVSLCCLVLDSADGKDSSEAHEWCLEGVGPAVGEWGRAPRSEYPFSKILESEGVLAVEDVSLQPAETRELLEPRGIRAVIVAALELADGAHGFVAFAESTRPRAWSEVEKETLKTITGMIATAYSRHHLARRLSVSEQNFRNFFHTVDEIIVVADLEARIVFANEGAVRKLHYPPEEYLGRSVIDFVPPEAREQSERIVSAMLSGDIDEQTVEVITKEGALIPLQIRVWFGQWDGRDRVFVLGKDLSFERAERLRFEGLFRNNPAAMAIHSVDDGRCVDANEAYLRVFGYSRDEVVGQPGPELHMFADDPERWSQAKEELLTTGTLRNRELTFRRKDGRVVHGLFSGDILTSQGQTYALTVMIDVTEESQLQVALAAERNRLANIIDGTRLGTWEWNLQTGATTYNERWAEILGYTLADLTPTTVDTWTRLSHPDDVAESDRLIREHIQGKTEFYDFEGRMLHKNGDWVWIHDRGKVIERDGEGRPLLMYGTHTDVTERKAMEEQIRDLSIRDPLTGVYNRRYVFERLSEVVAEYSRYGRNFCVSILDIDHFKLVNDVHGHQAGDFALREFAHTIASTIRKNDLLGRYGGEEFIIVSSVGWPEIAALIERVMSMVRGRAFMYQDREIRFTFSCGLADSSEFSRETCSTGGMVSLADERLYEAKAAGRDCFVGPRTGRVRDASAYD